MASILSLRSTGIRPCAMSDHRRSDPQRAKAASSSAHWWAPLFGVQSEPDYIEGEQKAAGGADQEATRVGSRFAPGCFTEEKARELRMKTMEAATFHDIMYHSAIASRLASDVPNRRR